MYPRKRIRLSGYDYSTPGSYFVTICAYDNQPLFAQYTARADDIRPYSLQNTAVGALIEQALQQLPSVYPHVSVDKYCIMPDHLHLILTIHAGDLGNPVANVPLQTIVGQMKRWVTKQYSTPVWQKSFFDHVIRSREAYRQIWYYIEQNPLKPDNAANHPSP